MKREDQQDATISCLLLTSVSTCFGYHYAQSSGEQRPCYCIWCIVLVLLDVVGSGCGALRCRMRAHQFLKETIHRKCLHRQINPVCLNLEHSG